MVRAVHLDDSQQIAEVAKQKGKAGFKAAKTGFEGKEEQIGKAVHLALKTMARLHAIQFAKDHGLMAEYVAHDVKTMSPINTRVATIIERTGDKESALVGLCERTACHYHLVLETEAEPGVRRWKSPWGHVLNACKKLKMFDLTEQEIHEQWFTPRIHGFAKDMGVNVKVSEWNDDGIIEISLVD